MGCGASAKRYRYAPGTQIDDKVECGDTAVFDIATEDEPASLRIQIARLAASDEPAGLARRSLRQSRISRESSLAEYPESPDRSPRTSDWRMVSKDMPIVTATDTGSMEIAAPVIIIEPWCHVGHNHLNEEVRASTNAAVLSKRIGLEVQCVPLWDLGSSFGPDRIAQNFYDKTIVFEGGDPSVYDASSFSDKCPRSYLLNFYKYVFLAPSQVGSAIFVCLSHQLAMAALVDLVKDAIKELTSSGDPEAARVAHEVRCAGENVRILKDGHEICRGYDHVNEQGWEQFATAKNEAREGGLMRLYPFDTWINEQVAVRPDLQKFIDAHSNIASSQDEIKNLMEETSDSGLYVAMFHGDEVNVEAALFTNWALSQIHAVKWRVLGLSSSARWLETMPAALEVLCCTVDHHTSQVLTDVAAMRIDYSIGGFMKSYHSCQFHPELDGYLRDARKLEPGFGEDGAKLFHRLLTKDVSSDGEVIVAA